MTGTAAALLFVVGLAAPPAPRDLRSLHRRFSDLAREKKYSYSNRGVAPLLFEAAREATEVSKTVDLLADRLCLPHEAAVRLVRSALADGVARMSARRPGRPPTNPTEEELAEIEEGYLDPLRSAPDTTEALFSLIDFYSTWKHGSPGLQARYAERVLSLVQRASDPPRTAIAVLVEWSGDDSLVRGLLPLARARFQEHPAVLRVMIQRGYATAVRAPLAQLARRNLAGIAEKGDREVELELAEQELDAYLRAGLSREAVEAYRALTDEIASAIRAGTDGKFTTYLNGFSYSGWLKDLRLDVAAAFVLEGDVGAARRMLESVPEISASMPDPKRPARRQRTALVQILGSAATENPFDLLADAVSENQMQGPLWTRVVAILASGMGNREAQAEALRSAKDGVARELGDPPPELFELPREAESRSASIRQAGAVLIARVERELDALSEFTGASHRPDVMASRMARLLESRPAQIYAERPLRSGTETIEMGHEEEYQRLTALRAELRIPREFSLVRAEHRPDEILAVVTFQSWTTDLASRIYWLIRSTDGGAHWTNPLCLGLRVSAPYSVRSFSNLPLLEGERVQIEVDVWENDPTRHAINGPARRKARERVYIETTLSALQKDTDGDGLPDVLEEMLFLDPRDSDTDGDGFGDGEDAMPNVPFVALATDRAKAFAAFVEQTVGWSRRLTIPRRRSGSAASETLPTPEVLYRRVFVFVGDRSLFAGLQPTARVIVLTPEEWKRLGDRREGISPIFVESFVMDEQGGHAVVRWTGANEGGSVRLEKREDGEWSATDSELWMS